MDKDKYVNEIKKFVRSYLEKDRFDMEWISKKDKEICEKSCWSYSGVLVEVHKGWVSLSFWDNSEVEGKDELWKVFNVEGKVLNCGKVNERFVGISNSCVCSRYEDGKEVWELSECRFWDKFDYDDSEWNERKERNG